MLQRSGEDNSIGGAREWCYHGDDAIAGGVQHGGELAESWRRAALAAAITQRRGATEEAVAS